MEDGGFVASRSLVVVVPTMLDPQAAANSDRAISRTVRFENPISWPDYPHRISGSPVYRQTSTGSGLLLGIASGEKNEGDAAAWLAERVQSSDG